MGQRQLFDFVHGDLLAVAVNLVLRAAGHLKVLACDQSHNVAGAVEAVLGEAVAVRVLLQVVAANRVGAAGKQVAALAALNRLVLIINNQNFIVGANRVTLSPQAQLNRVGRAGVVHQTLSHAEHLLNGAAEHRLNLACNRRG